MSGEGPRWVVVDLEATCWASDDALAADQRNETETLEIGAVRVDPGLPLGTGGWTAGDRFRTLVRPRRRPQLSAFCTALTGISQAEADAAPEFPAAFAAFLGWAGGDEGLVLVSWGGFDDRLLRRDAARWELPPPRWTHRNGKRLFAKFARAHGAPDGGWLGLDAALGFLGGSFAGRRHSAVDDAYNAAWVLCEVQRRSGV